MTITMWVDTRGALIGLFPFTSQRAGCAPYVPSSREESAERCDPGSFSSPLSVRERPRLVFEARVRVQIPSSSRVPSLLAVIPTGVCGVEGPRLFFLAFLCQGEGLVFEARVRVRIPSSSRVPSLLAVIPTGVCGVEGPRLPSSLLRCRRQQRTRTVEGTRLLRRSVASNGIGSHRIG